MKKTSPRPEAGDIMATTIVGERGQIVIPKEIRDSMKLSAGSRLVIVRHPNGPILMFPMEDMRAFMEKMTSRFATLESTKE